MQRDFFRRSTTFTSWISRCGLVVAAGPAGSRWHIGTASHRVIRTASHRDIETSRHRDSESSSHRVIESSSHQVIKSSSHQVIKSSGQRVIEASRHRVIRTASHQDSDTSRERHHHSRGFDQQGLWQAHGRAIGFFRWQMWLEGRSRGRDQFWRPRRALRSATSLASRLSLR